MRTSSAKKGALTSGDLDKIGDLLDNRLAPMATKEFVQEEIKGLDTSLKTYMHEGFDAVMEGMDNLAEELGEKEKVERLVKWAKEASEKIGVKIDI